jgi:hypothetical protein
MLSFIPPWLICPRRLPVSGFSWVCYSMPFPRKNFSLSDPDAQASPPLSSYGTMSCKQHAHSSQFQHEQVLVGVMAPPPSTTAPADVSQLPDPMSNLPTSSTIFPSAYSLPHAASTATLTNDSMCQLCVLHTPSGSLSSREQSFPTQRCLVSPSPNRYHSEPDIRSAAAQPSSHYCVSVTEAEYQQEWRGLHRGTGSNSGISAVDRRLDEVDIATCSSWERRRAERVRGVMATMPTQSARSLVIAVGPPHSERASFLQICLRSQLRTRRCSQLWGILPRSLNS